MAAVASNLPFGRQYELQGRPERWFAAALDELARVVRPGGRIVLLVPGSPAFEGALGRQSAVRAAERLELRLLGTRAALWSLHRR